MKMDDYLWDFVTPKTLKEMRDYISQQKSWLDKGVKNLALSIENYFLRKQWHYTKDYEEKSGKAACLLNSNLFWSKFKKGEKPEGVCIDQACFFDATSKSVGIPVLTFGLRKWYDKSKLEWYGHHAYFFFDGEEWEPTPLQIHYFKNSLRKGENRYYLNVLVPPWNQVHYLSDALYTLDKNFAESNMYYEQYTTIDEIEKGIPTETMRKWLGLD